MIDMHCHVLPGIDDGSKDLTMSLEMLEIAEKDKTDIIIVTPHFYRGRYENVFKDVLIHVKNLNSQATSNGINVKLYPGQEIFVDKYTLDLYKDGTIHGLNDSKYLLIEFPMDVLPSDALDIIYELKLLGVKPIIAHPERYLYISSDLTGINRFIEEGCLFQLNTSSILGLMGRQVKETADKLLENGICNFIASDAHSTGKRCPNLGTTMKEIKKQYPDVYKSVEENAENVLNNNEIHVTMKKFVAKKGMFSFLFKK
ncbi:tyrosine-protein phosphatase [Clostridium akagii]|uniref:tyrosine-protein phosphatase n=1 Tax=Clostridium akagii TaxID=91623 RepID=UPI00047DD78E|nr:CpsB/CapC family capsule biosynthesis tyrosine phosphatase [Clostridium akagii]